MNLALLIVVPMFLACYCGSCIAYIVYKIYRNCCRRAKPQPADLEGADTPIRESRAPPAFPAYLHAPGRSLPPPAKQETLPGGRRMVPPRYETKAAGAMTEKSAYGSDGVPISEILMKKVAQKPSAAY